MTKRKTTIAWKQYGIDSWYSENVRTEDGRAEFKIAHIEETNKYALLDGFEQIAEAGKLNDAKNYFESILQKRGKIKQI